MRTLRGRPGRLWRTPMTNHPTGTGTRSALPVGKSHWPVPARFLVRSSRLSLTPSLNVSIVTIRGNTSPALASLLRFLRRAQAGQVEPSPWWPGAAVKLARVDPERYRAAVPASDLQYPTLLRLREWLSKPARRSEKQNSWSLNCIESYDMGGLRSQPMRTASPGEFHC